jgi:hypothetical protein
MKKVLKFSGGNRQIKKFLPARSHFATTFGGSQELKKKTKTRNFFK